MLALAHWTNVGLIIDIGIISEINCLFLVTRKILIRIYYLSITKTNNILIVIINVPI